jgi:hypothetical protein
MLPLYKAKRLIHILEKGGRTKPWLVEVEVEDEIERFAVQLFTPQQVDALYPAINSTKFSDK